MDASPSCRVQVEVEVAVAGDAAVVRLAGELDADSSRAVRRCLTALAADGVRRVRLDARRLSFLDAAGLGVLIGAARRLREAGGELRLEAPSRPVARVLALTGATAALGVMAD